ncbi:MAG: DUF401 family protein [Firmicutes bacterium]|nr:DUF401 family protein [Bacillota bacterium]
MQFISNIPWIVKILSTLGVILVANRLFKNLSLAVVIGTLALALLSGHSTATFLSISSNTLFSWANLSLLIAIAQINFLSAQMAETKIMQDLVGLIQSRLSPRVSMAVLPSVIGLLPVPGGALFSAPLVDECDIEKKSHPCLKSVINFWFRHVWEFWWPLYPGVLLAMELTGLNTLQFLIFGLPLSLAAIAAGYVFLLQKIPGGRQAASITNGEFFKRFLFLTSPIIIVVGIQACFQLFFPALTNANQHLPISLGLIVASLFLQSIRPLDSATWRRIIGEKKLYSLLLLIALIKVYAAFIDARLPDGTPLVAKLSAELTAFGIPLLVMTMLLPFISGLTTGLSLAFVGASFPIVLSFLGPDPTLAQMLATLALSYGFGLMGIMLSPVHICLLVSNEYFEAKLSSSLRFLLKPAVVVISFALLFYVLFNLLPG